MLLAWPSWRGGAAIARSHAGNVISQLDRRRHQPERLEAFARSQKSHMAIIEDAPKDRLIDLHALDFVHIHLVRPAADEACLVNDAAVRDRDFGGSLNEPFAKQKNERDDRK